MSKSSLQKTIQRILKKAGLDVFDDDIMLTHGFRKFAVTMMKKAKIDWSDREFLVGHRHSRGLDVQYDKTSEEDRLVEWSKAINLLTIEKSSFHLQKELQIYKDEYAHKIEELSRKLEEQVQISEKARHDYEMTRKDFGNYIKLNERGDEKIAQITQTIQRSKDIQEKLEKKMKELGIK